MDRSGTAIFNPSNHAVPWQQSVYDLLRSSYVAEGGRQMQRHAVQTLSEIFCLLYKCLHVCVNCCFIGCDSFLLISSVYSEWLVSQKFRNLTGEILKASQENSGFNGRPWWLIWVLYAYTHTCSHLMHRWQTESKPGSCVYLPTGLSLQRGHISPQAHLIIMLHTGT